MRTSHVCNGIKLTCWPKNNILARYIGSYGIASLLQLLGCMGSGTENLMCQYT